eukprot:11371953-Alexandrium_andersonii.AAC.1
MQDANLGGTPILRWSCAWRGPGSSRRRLPQPRGIEHLPFGERGPPLLCAVGVQKLQVQMGCPFFDGGNDCGFRGDGPC